MFHTKHSKEIGLPRFRFAPLALSVAFAACVYHTTHMSHLQRSYTLSETSTAPCGSNLDSPPHRRPNVQHRHDTIGVSPAAQETHTSFTRVCVPPLSARTLPRQLYGSVPFRACIQVHHRIGPQKRRLPVSSPSSSSRLIVAVRIQDTCPIMDNKEGNPRDGQDEVRERSISAFRQSTTCRQPSGTLQETTKHRFWYAKHHFVLRE